MNLIRQHPLSVIFFLVFVGVVAVTANTWLENRSHSNGGGWGEGKVTVITQPAQLIDFTNKIESIGTARANESVVLTSKVTDTIRKVNFEDGMFVNKGDILVEMTNTEQTALLQEAQATAGEASRQFNRVQNLIAQKLASETQLDIERVRMQTAQARLEAIMARLDDHLVRAPFSGLLGFRNVSTGTMLNPTTPITTIDDVSIIKLDFDVPENFLAALKPSQEVLANSVAYPGRPFTGTVATIDSRVDPVTRTVTVRAHIKNDEALLRPGMLLTVNLILARDQALVVPESAIEPMQDRHYVYIISNAGIAEQIPVKVGRRQPGFVEILDGVELGQHVITEGIMKIRPGSSVVRKSGQT